MVRLGAAWKRVAAKKTQIAEQHVLRELEKLSKEEASLDLAWGYVGQAAPPSQQTMAAEQQLPPRGKPRSPKSSHRRTRSLRKHRGRTGQNCSQQQDPWLQQTPLQIQSRSPRRLHSLAGLAASTLCREGSPQQGRPQKQMQLPTATSRSGRRRH